MYHVAYKHVGEDPRQIRLLTENGRTKGWTEAPVSPFQILETVLAGARSTWPLRAGG